MENTNDNLIPIEAIHPTEILKDEMMARGINNKEMAARLGMQASNFSRMLRNKEHITPQMANRLENVLDIPAIMWLNLQAQYEKDLIAINSRDKDESEYVNTEKRLSDILNLALILKRLGIDGFYFAKDRIEFLYKKLNIKNIEQVLSIATPSGFFKKSEKMLAEEKSLNAWVLLAYAKCLNETIKIPYKQGNVIYAAKEIATLTNNEKITEALIKTTLNNYGIGYCYVEKIPKVYVDAYSTIINNTPYIVTSHRHDNMDMLVFNVLHELHHIDTDLNNGQANISYNEETKTEKDAREKAANKFAEDILIPPPIWKQLMKTQSPNISPYSVYSSMIEQAKKQGISPSIASWRYKYQTNIYNIKGNKSPKIK